MTVHVNNKTCISYINKYTYRGNQTILMAATLDREKDTASGATDVPHLPAAARNVRGPGSDATGEGVQPATTVMRSPDGKSERGDDGAKCVGRSGNDEDTEDEGIMCTGEAVERREDREMAE